jgi:hypothetical protein
MDLCATVVGGALILPLLLMLALLVYLESGGPIFYRDRRMGQDGKLFSCVKFRTMVPDAEALLQRMLEEDTGLREEYSKYHKLRDDPRVTRVGRFLRKTSLDELRDPGTHREERRPWPGGLLGVTAKATLCSGEAIDLEQLVIAVRYSLLRLSPFRA